MIKTAATTASNPVLYLFKYAGETEYSWVDDDGGDGPQSKLTVNISVGGWYVIFVRARGGSRFASTSDLYFQNSLYQANITLAGDYYDFGSLVRARSPTSAERTFTVDPINSYILHITGNMFQLTDCMRVRVRSTGVLPAPLKENTDYFVTTAPGCSNCIYLWQQCRDGTPIQMMPTSTGTHTIYPYLFSGTNYFTADPTTPYSLKDTWLWLAEGFTTPILASNDNYWTTNPHDYYWRGLSRINKDFGNRDVGYVFVSAAYPTGNDKCDIYLKCRSWLGDNSTFPHIKFDDAIQSASATSGYNCHAWAGGFTIRTITPDIENELSNPWYDHRGSELSFDNFYANRTEAGDIRERWPGAPSYFPTTDLSTAVVALWYNPNATSQYTHSSVRKPGNGQPHGYDWESKIGSYERFFHPINALEGDAPNEYGAIAKYYGENPIVQSTAAQLASTESDDVAYVNSGCVVNKFGHHLKCTHKHPKKTKTTETVLAKQIWFDRQEIRQVRTLASLTGPTLRRTFDSLFVLWQGTWSDSSLLVFSSPDVFFYSQEWGALHDFCVSIGKSIAPLFMQMFLQDREDKTIYAMCKLGLVDQDGRIKDQVRAQSLQSTYTVNGAFVYDRPGNGYVRYIRALLEQEF